MNDHECRYCGETFTSAYFRNVHQAESCPEKNGEE